MHTHSQHIGLNMRMLANKKKFRVSEIANAMKVSRQTVYDLYKRESVSTKILEEFSQVIGVEPNEIFNNVKQDFTNNVDTSPKNQTNHEEYIKSFLDRDKTPLPDNLIPPTPPRDTLNKDEYIEYLRGTIKWQSEVLNITLESMNKLISMLPGKFKASGLLAGAYA